MIRTEKRLRLCTCLILCNLVFIWGNSLLPGAVSGAFSDWVKGILDALLGGGNGPFTGSGLLRKAAHFTEFGCLGALLAWRMGMLKKHPFRAFVLAAAAACIDETIQIFVPDRGPGVKDVCIDSCGALAGIILLRLGHTYLQSKNHLEET